MLRKDIASEGAERKPAALPAFAPVPWAALRAGDRLSDGAVKAYALLCGLARVQNPRPEDPGDYGEFEDVRPPAGGWGAALGCTDRTARRWIAELIDAEFVIREAEAEFVIVHAEGPRALISLELLTRFRRRCGGPGPSYKAGSTGSGASPSPARPWQPI